MTNINELPPELLAKIFQHLHAMNGQDRFAYSLVPALLYVVAGSALRFRRTWTRFYTTTVEAFETEMISENCTSKSGSRELDSTFVYFAQRDRCGPALIDHRLSGDICLRLLHRLMRRTSGGLIRRKGCWRSKARCLLPGFARVDGDDRSR